MALEAFMFSEDPLISSYTTCYSKEYNYLNNNNNNNSGIFSMDYYYDLGNYSSIYTNDCGIFDVINSDNTTISNQEILVDDVNQWVHDTQAQQQCNNNNNNNYSLFCEYSSPEEAPPPSMVANKAAEREGVARRKRRRRSSKNKEEVEQQRMTHIAVERNRRRQMNDYLASIRSLMPSSYVQRGDQASIVAGAINYVKELEQLLQSMEAQKKSTNPHYHLQEESQSTLSPPDEKQCDDTVDNNVVTNSSPNQPPTPAPAPAPTLAPPVFAEFFSFPQYSTGSTGLVNQQQSVGSNSVSSNSGVGEIEVTMVESHANVKILAKKQPKQLLKLIAGFQGLRLNVLHLNVTTSLDSFVLYSLSLKVEEGCQLNSVDDIAAAANHILAQIQEEAVVIL